MNALIIFEDHAWRQFVPLTYWRTVSQLTCGRWSLADRCQAVLGAAEGWWVRSELAAVTAARSSTPVNTSAHPDVLLANGRWIPMDPDPRLPTPGVGVIDDAVACVRCDARLAERLNPQVMTDPDQLADRLNGIPRAAVRGIMLHHPWDLLGQHRDLLLHDWLPTDAGIHGMLQTGAHAVHKTHLHVGSDTIVRCGAVLDAQEGPIHIGKRVIVHPNAVIQGPTVIADDAVINAGAWIRGEVTIGTGSKIGGEVSSSIIMSRTNKQHHGFVGDSIIGTWVNLGAGTTTSNLKNTYGEINVSMGGAPVSTRRRFMGSIIGDFAKTGINQSLTTGSVIGFGSSIATATLSTAFTPSFRFITARRDEPYDPPRCLEVARRTMARRNRDMLDAEREWFLHLPQVAAVCETV